MFQSALLKLALWYVTLAMTVSLVFSFAFYYFAARELGEGLHDEFTILVSNDHDADNKNNILTTELHARSQHLLDDLVYLNIFVLAASTASGYLFARRALRPIEIAHQAQIRFSAEASHELRTPLTAMKADTESVLMQPGLDATLLHHALEDNLHDIERLEKLTNHLLEMARYKVKGALHKENFDLSNVAKQVIKQLKLQYMAKHVIVTLTAEPIKLMADPIALQQLISIIIDNAIKYSRAKGHVDVLMQVSNGYVNIEVKDEGSGINPKDLPHVYKHFYRSTHASGTGQQASGYGLGLPLAKDITTFYSGKITIKNREPNGTDVTIQLPIKHLQ
jgi:signal transduction histidine kinase